MHPSLQPGPLLPAHPPPPRRLPSLEAGFSRQLFADWAEEPRNAVIFVTRAEEGTLAEQVQQLGQQAAQQAAQQGQQGQQAEAPTIRMLRSHRVPLEGEELEAHLAQQAQQAEAAAEAAARQAAAAAQSQGPDAMQVDDGPGSAAAAAVAAADGGTLSPRASAAVPRVNSLAIGHLKSFRPSGGPAAFAGTPLQGEVVGPDGLPVQELQEAATTAQCLVEGFEVPKARRGGAAIFNHSDGSRGTWARQLGTPRSACICPLAATLQPAFGTDRKLLARLCFSQGRQP